MSHYINYSKLQNEIYYKGDKMSYIIEQTQNKQLQLGNIESQSRKRMEEENN